MVLCGITTRKSACDATRIKNPRQANSAHSLSSHLCMPLWSIDLVCAPATLCRTSPIKFSSIQQAQLYGFSLDNSSPRMQWSTP